MEGEGNGPGEQGIEGAAYHAEPAGPLQEHQGERAEYGGREELVDQGAW